jgi:hypothetical protein
MCGSRCVDSYRTVVCVAVGVWTATSLMAAGSQERELRQVDSQVDCARKETV